MLGLLHLYCSFTHYHHVLIMFVKSLECHILIMEHTLIVVQVKKSTKGLRYCPMVSRIIFQSSCTNFMENLRPYLMNCLPEKQMKSCQRFVSVNWNCNQKFVKFLFILQARVVFQ
uniref:Putative product n=1 Tax=Xenopsylla cheopis TaxID=163159 RepID=A0A6M2DX37_XENCH